MKKDKEKTFVEVAARLGLQFINGSLFKESKVKGQINGRSTILDTYGTGGKVRTRHTRVRICLTNPAKIAFTLHPSTTSIRLVQKIGIMNKITLPNNILEKWTLSSEKNTESLQPLFSLAFQSLIETFPAEADSSIKLENNELRFENSRWITDTNLLLNLIDLLSKITTSIEKLPATTARE